MLRSGMLLPVTGRIGRERARQGGAAPRHALRRLAGLLLLVLAVAGLVWEVWVVTLQGALVDAENAGRQRLSLYASSIANALDKFRYLPVILARDKDILALLRTPKDQRLTETVDRNLEAINDAAFAAAIYVMDATGLTLAASNWRGPASFVGNSYAFRPYFRQAAARGSGNYFGVGVTSHVPGYFMARAIVEGGRLLGVVAVKVDLEPLERDWARAGEGVIVTDSNRIAFLSSRQDWKYATLAPLSPAAQATLAATQQYANAALHPLDLAEDRVIDDATRLVHITTRDGESRQLMQSLRLPFEGWTIYYLTDYGAVRAHARHNAVMASVVAVAALLLLLYLRQRRRGLQAELEARGALADALREARDELDYRVRVRTSDLEAANLALQSEIQERQKAEVVLRKAQEDLVHAGKLAALGQMSAAVAHELNQPLTAIQTFLASTRIFAERGETKRAIDNLAVIEELNLRMARITDQLRSLAYKGMPRRAQVPLKRTVERALVLLEDRLRRAQVELIHELPAEAVVWGDEVRLEQVLVNLIRNALDAMAGSAQRRLAIRATPGQGRWILRVTDTGHGLPAADLPHLFEPFVTTKVAGEGLGLGLAVCYGIVRDLGGSIRAENNSAGGASFIVELPASEAASKGAEAYA